jgi:hypothetical protein
MKAKFAYLCTSSCCHPRNTLLVKPCTSRDDGDTAGNSLGKSFSRIPRSSVVTLRSTSRKSPNLCPFREYFSVGKSEKSQGLIQVNKMDGPFF